MAGSPQPGKLMMWDPVFVGAIGMVEGSVGR
jgi:hypothetical protein